MYFFLLRLNVHIVRLITNFNHEAMLKNLDVDDGVAGGDDSLGKTRTILGETAKALIEVQQSCRKG